jgi:hypothetical protein
MMKKDITHNARVCFINNHNPIVIGVLAIIFNTTTAITHTIIITGTDTAFTQLTFFGLLSGFSLTYMYLQRKYRYTIVKTYERAATIRPLNKKGML